MTSSFVKGLVRVFIFAFLGAFFPLVVGLSAAPDFKAGRAVAISAVIGGLAAGVKAVTDTLTKEVSPLPQVGILSPEIKS